MIIHNVPQKTIEWHELRWGKVTGSSAKGLFTDSDALFLRLLSEHIEDFEYEEGYSSPDMERGAEYEQYARLYLNSYCGVDFKEVGFIESSENSLLGISPDGVNDNLTIACEVKCFGRKKHTEVIYNKAIPLEYTYQLIHYFTVIDTLESLYFIAYRPESAEQYIEAINRDSLVNIGTKSKPIKKTISEAVEIAKKNAMDLNIRLNQTLNNYNQF